MVKKMIVVMMILIMTPCLIAFSSEPRDVIGTEYEEAVKILYALNIFKGNETGLFEPDKSITRAETASVLVRMIVGDAVDMQSGTDSIFSDLPSDNLVVSNIKTALNLGIIDGFSDGRFRPDEGVTFEQAVKMIVCALGYEAPAQSKGGYPSGYLLIAAEKGITDGVVGVNNKPITRGVFAMLIYKALDSELLEQITFGNNAQYLSQKSGTLLTKRLSITKQTGRITENGNTALTGTSHIKSNEVYINGESFMIGDTNADEFLGYYVNYYFKVDATNERILLYVEPKKGMNKTLRINADEKLKYDFATRQYTYYENDKLKTAMVSGVADVIYNGRFVSTYQNEIFVPISGHIILLDSKNNGEYDTVLVTAYDMYVVENVNIQDGIIFDKYNKSKMLLLDPNTKIPYSIISDDGSKLELSELNEWDVLAVTKSLDGEFVRALRISDYTEGKITEITNQGNLQNLEIKVGSKAYEIGYSYAAFSAKPLSVGDEGVFYFDIEGKIAAFNTTDFVEGEYGYLIKAANNEKGIEKESQFKIFNQYEEMLILTGKDKMKLDEKSSIPCEDVVRRLNEEGGISEIIKYKINEDGKITEIDRALEDRKTAYDTLNSGLYRSGRGVDLKYYIYNKTFAGKVATGTDTIVFLIPNNEENDRDYKIRKPGYLTNGMTYTFDAYNSDITSITADVILMKLESTGSVIDYTSSIALVSGISYIVNDDDECVEKVKIFQDGKEIELWTESENFIKNNGIEQGDTIRYGLNAQGDINSVEKIFDESSHTYLGTTTLATAYDTTYRTVWGSVYSAQKGGIMITDADLSNPTTDLSAIILEYHQFNKYKLCMYNSETKKASYAIIDDVYGFVEAGSEYSKVLVYSRSGDPRTIVIYK